MTRGFVSVLLLSVPKAVDGCSSCPFNEWCGLACRSAGLVQRPNEIDSILLGSKDRMHSVETTQLTDVGEKLRLRSNPIRKRIPGQRKVALYAVQSPQHWFEDFGSGQLANGSVRISLEPGFEQTVNSGSGYHVFLTPKGDCRGLYVTNETAEGFEVHELGGGQSSVAFDYRIVALRRGYENVRMEDMTERLKQANAAMPIRSGPRPAIPFQPAAVHNSQVEPSIAVPASLSAQR
jgi:hypothetical protein